ncbi:GNAT family N-acetyltransferase [Streptomyces californicus]|uniref:GNAT family N-acetyltransferase n=1 Tax=Streptomyces californicus TaxID=67351 RepID=UPI0036F830C1
MEAEDLPYVVAEHLAHFPDGFFARLGPGFLTRYTATYLDSPYARGYLLEHDGEPVGFLVGVTDPASHRRRLVDEHGRALALRASAALMARPALAVHFTRTRAARYSRKLLPQRGRAPAAPAAERAGAVGPPQRVAVLAHVVVSVPFRSHGLGATLTNQFVQDAAAYGCSRVSLVTETGDKGAGKFYERLGWHFGGETRTPEGRRLSSYSFPLYPIPPLSRGTL